MESHCTGRILSPRLTDGCSLRVVALAGFCWPQSASGNEVITLFCHGSTGRADVQVARQGQVEHVVLETNAPVSEQPLSASLSERGCYWRPCTEIRIDPSWRSGFYLVRIRSGDEVAHAFFVVRAAKPSNALLVLSTSTWAAYND